MKILLTDEEIYEIARELTGEDWEPDIGYRLALTSKKALKAQLKKFMEYLTERADYIEWEWKDSKGIWDIVLDDIAWQALLKEAGEL